jgi:hypothetical protein
MKHSGMKHSQSARCDFLFKRVGLICIIIAKKVKNKMSSFLVQNLLYVDQDPSNMEMTFRATPMTDYNGFVAFERNEFNTKYKSETQRKCGSSVHLMGKHVEIEFLLNKQLDLLKEDIDKYLLDVYIVVDGYCESKRRLIYRIVKIGAKPIEGNVIEDDDENDNLLEEYEIKEMFNSMMDKASHKLNQKKEKLHKIETLMEKLEVSLEGIEHLENIIQNLDKKTI